MKLPHWTKLSFWRGRLYWKWRDARDTWRAFRSGAPRKCCNENCWYYCKGHTYSSNDGVHYKKAIPL